ncbi:tetratricopeptide repeat protein [Halomonas halocynthiae]|uniref:tetratricopeptide repeat protein n=1 Tax=Halomonas halocynthiae TaxID=176290 RepID=UPI0004093097|nr:tetratricopeptide repeat protein [Halomonas halocynthiae]
MTGCTRALGRLRFSIIAFSAGLLLSGCANLSGDNDRQPHGTAEVTAAYTRLGTAYLKNNNLPRATTALKHALTADPHNAEALQALALVYSRQGEIDQADAMFQKALTAAPEMTQARNNYAVFLYQQGHVTAACVEFERAADDSHYAHRAQLLDNLEQCQRQLSNSHATQLQNATSR